MNQQVAVVTGASRGLGLELAILLCKSDYRVVGVSRTSSSDTRWAALVAEGALLHVCGDVAEPAVVDESLRAARDLGTLTLMVSCAGVGIFGPVGSYCPEDISTAFRANLVGTVLFGEAAFRALRDEGGTIVNVMSTASQVIRPNEAVYGAAKWGARAYTETLRAEAKGTDVRVIAVYPGGMNASFWEKARGASPNTSTFMDAREVAAIVIDLLQRRSTCYVSDITINRLR